METTGKMLRLCSKIYEQRFGIAPWLDANVWRELTLEIGVAQFRTVLQK